MEEIKIHFILNYSPPVFYLFIAFIILTIIAFPFMVDASRIGLTTIWLLGYLICRLLLYPILLPYEPQTILFIIAELGLLGLAVTLSCHLVGLMQGFELLQERLLKPSTNFQIRFIKNTIEEISAEFYRCRRYNHTLSILAIEPSTASFEYQAQVNQKSQKKLLQRFITINLAELISQQIRRFDLILIREWNGRFYILCPENTEEGTKNLALRINENTQKHLGISLNFGYAVFPRDALTFEELLRQAENNLHPAFDKFNHTPEHASEYPGKNDFESPDNNPSVSTQIKTDNEQDKL